MKIILINVLAVVIGTFIGGAVNMGIILISGSIIPPPEGADMTTMEGLQASMKLMEPKHFIMPFLAHALGTFVGAVIAGLISRTHAFRVAFIVGVLFLIGGIMVSMDLPAPTWFVVLDLVAAYIPMAYLASKLVRKKQVKLK